MGSSFILKVAEKDFTVLGNKRILCHSLVDLLRQISRAFDNVAHAMIRNSAKKKIAHAMMNTKKLQNPCPETSRYEESSNSCYYRFNERGFPNSCVCGRDVTVLTSQSIANPGRPYFRCASKADGHLFKWVEGGMYEEVVDMLERESKINKDLKAMVQHLEEEIGWCKGELCKAKIKDMLMAGCIVGLVVFSLWIRKR